MKSSHCGICEFYSNRACSKVSGAIDPAYWCRLFVKKRKGFAEGGAPEMTAPFPEAPGGYPFFTADSASDTPSGVLPSDLPPVDGPPAERGPIAGFLDRFSTPSQSPMEPDLQQMQTGEMPEIPGVAPKHLGIDEHGRVVDTSTPDWNPVQFDQRPGVLPLAKDQEGQIHPAMSKALDLASNIMGGNVPGGGAFLGSGLARAAKAPAIEKVHELSGIPRAEAERIMAENADRGLSFPLEEASDRARLKLERERKEAAGKAIAGDPQERTVISAPEGLPDFVAGKITPQDWVARHESLLSPDEIKAAAKWYDVIFDEFLKQTKGDVPKARQYMRGWLVAQQNVDVSGAMGNVLLQSEQIKRGVPEAKMRGAGMPNPTQAARAVMQDKPIAGGVGQKISDFVDAAEGKDVRSWMANHPSGGSPFVVDVHTGRDTGMVDQELINHLGRLGYDKEALKKLKVDMAGTPSAPQYENRSNFGRDLTDYLNNIGWQGRNDWKPREVQAVGWMGMTKLTANKADDVVAGLSRNMSHISMELSPGEGSPWAQKYGDRFYALQPEDQFSLTHGITQNAIDHASNLAGIDVRDIVHGTGGWGGPKNAPNPSTVAQLFATKEGAEIAANALGHMLQQTEVWANKVKPMTTAPSGFAVDFVAKGNHNLNTDEGLRDVWSKIISADPGGKDPLFKGYQPIVTRDGESGIRVLIDRGGKGLKNTLDKALAGPVADVLKTLPYDMGISLREAEITKAINNWKEQKNGEGYLSRLRELIGRDPAAYLDTAGKELEEKFRSGLEQAEAKGRAQAAPAAKAKPVAPQPKPNELGFYSATQHAIEAAPQAKASPQQWMGMLRNAPGVKQEEMKWLGLEEWLKSRSSSAEEGKASGLKNSPNIGTGAANLFSDLSEAHPSFVEGIGRINIPSNAAAKYASSVEGVAANPKSKSDFLNFLSGGGNGFGLLDVEPRRAVMDGMVAAVHDPQVRQSIVGLIPIDVMHDFVGTKFSPNRILNDPSVLKNAFSVNRDASISPKVDVALERIMSDPAIAATKLLGSSLRTAGESVEGLSAMKAGKGDHPTSIDPNHAKGNTLISKQEISDFVKANNIEIKEVTKGANLESSPEMQRLDAENNRLASEYNGLDLPDPRANEITDLMNANHDRMREIADEIGPTKFHSYTLPGGENYRELLLTLPDKVPPEHRAAVAAMDEPARRELAAKYPEQMGFRSSHWDEPNVLAHIRFNDRVIDGKKTLFVEEVQSDWHQKGKREGYKSDQPFTNEDREELQNLRHLHSDAVMMKNQPLPPEQMTRLDELEKRREAAAGTVPDAPFKTTWPELSMKRVLKYAADNGYEKVAWTPGDVQAARYDLSKHVDEIHYDAERQRLAYKNKGADTWNEVESVPKDKLDSYIGKDAAEKILNTHPSQGIHKLAGVDLKVGGEGMRGFYDQILPTTVNKLVKKYGAKVEQNNLPSKVMKAGPGDYRIIGNDNKGLLMANGEPLSFKTEEEALNHPGARDIGKVHAVTITPQMKKAISEQGFPQFSTGGSVKPRLTPVAHNPFEAHSAARRAMHGHKHT
jgi:hypothetical protein